MAKYVASTTLRDLEWENSHLIEGDVAEGVAKLNEQPGQDLVIYGCLDLMHGLLEHHLVDEYGQVTVGQQQPGPLGGVLVEQARRAW